MKRYLVLIAAAMLMSVTSCVKPFELQLPLAVNNERIDLLDNQEGFCYIPVYSTGAWEISFEQVPEDTSAVAKSAEVPADKLWCRTDVTSGSKYHNVRFSYDANTTGAERSILFVVEGEGERCEIVIVQPE